jgi:3-hydroxyisobutyrate dehydrogenase-like beta-hydroxyacid dehydrogenase
MSDTSLAVAVAGLGKMGSAYARRLAASSFQLLVANRSPARAEAFAREHGCAAIALGEVFAQAPTCVSAVPDSDALEDLVEVLLHEPPPPGRTLIDASTVSASASARVAVQLSGAGVAYLRAPVSGNPSVVDAGNLSLMVSGDTEVFQALRPVLEALGPTLFYLGAGERARVMKLALNIIVAGTTELMAEATLLCEAAGLDREQALAVMSGSVVASPLLKYKAPALASCDYTPTATTSLLAKDLDLALEQAAATGVPLPAAELVDESLHDCERRGYGEMDFLSLMLRLEAQTDGAARRPR